MTLAAQHKLVHAYPKNTFIKGEMARIIIIRLLGQALEKLSQKKPTQYLAVLRHLTLDGSSSEDEKGYKEFVDSQKKQLINQLHEELIATEQIKNTICALEDDVYPLLTHALSHRLTTLMSVFQANDNLNLALFNKKRPISFFIGRANNRLASLLANTAIFSFLLKAQGIKYKPLNVFGNWSLEKSFIKNWSEINKCQQKVHDLNAFIEGKTDKNAQRFAKDVLLLSLFSINKARLKRAHPKQSLWIESLTHNEIIELMKAIHKKHPGMVGNDSFDLIPELIIHATELGITANLSLEKLHFKDKDLRALNLKSVNLNETVFENCQLPLAGVNTQCNKVKLIKCSLAGIDENNPLDVESHFFINLCDFLDPPSTLTTQYFIQYLQSDGLQKTDNFGNTPLIKAAGSGHTECVKALLESKHCTLAVIKKLNTKGPCAAQVAGDKHPSIAQEIRRYATYLKIWENKNSFIAKITALITEYCKEKSPILAQHSQVVSSLINAYKAEKIDTNTLLNHLRELSNKSVEPPLSRYIKFIESRLPSVETNDLTLNKTRGDYEIQY